MQRSGAAVVFVGVLQDPPLTFLGDPAEEDPRRQDPRPPPPSARRASYCELCSTAPLDYLGREKKSGHVRGSQIHARRFVPAQSMPRSMRIRWRRPAAQPIQDACRARVLISCPVRCRGAWHVSLPSRRGRWSNSVRDGSSGPSRATPFLEGEDAPRGEAWRKQLSSSPAAHAAYRGHG